MTPEDDGAASPGHEDAVGRFGDRTVNRLVSEMFPQRPSAGDPPPPDARARPPQPGAREPRPLADWESRPRSW